MLFLASKYAVTALVVVIVSEVAKRSDKLGALIASLPLITIMVMIWLYLENQGHEKIGNHAYYTFWYVIPTLPMFIALPALLSKGVNFWLALGIGVVLTFVCFVVFAYVGRWWGIDLFPQ